MFIVFFIGIGSYFLFFVKNKSGQTMNITKITNQTNNIIDSRNEQESVPGIPLVTMNGKTLISVESLKTEKEKIFAANPQLQKLGAYMGEKELDKNLLAGLKSQCVIKEYISRNGIDKTADYQQELNMALEDVKRMINTKFFTQKFNAKVTDAEIINFYENNKNIMPNVVISRGGIMTKEITVNTETEAKNLIDKIKNKNFALDQAVKEAGIAESKIKDLKLINEQSTGIDNNLKTAILQSVSFPNTNFVKTTDNKYSVFVVTGKEEAKYQPMNDQIKNDIKTYLEREKQAEVVDKEIEKLQSLYNISVDESYFGPINANDTKELTPEILDLLEQDEESLPINREAVA